MAHRWRRQKAAMTTVTKKVDFLGASIAAATTCQTISSCITKILVSRALALVFAIALAPNPPHPHPVAASGLD